MLRAFEDLTRRIRVIRRLDFVRPERIASTYDEHALILDELDARRSGEAERLIMTHIESSRSEIRKITLHHIAMASVDDRSGSRANRELGGLDDRRRAGINTRQ